LIEDIIRELKEYSNDIGAEGSIVLSSAFWSSVDHVYIELIKGGKTSKYLAKMARFPGVSGQVQREANILKKLRDMRVKNVPEIVLDGSREGRAFLVERFIEGVRLKGSNFSKTENSRMRLDWMRGFYSQTLQGEIEPQELIQRADKVRELASDFADLTETLAVLESCKPVVKVPSVCWHGDADAINFLHTGDGLMAVDFGFAKFGEPPAEPYAMVSPGTLTESSKDLDLLSLLDGVSPFFLAIYANVMHLGEQLRVQAELEDNLLIVDQLREFPTRELGKIQILLRRYGDFKK
jgi:hypothetical protein